MSENRSPFFYALALYAGISVLLMSLQFFASGALVYLLFQSAHLPFFSGIEHLFRTSFYDSAGFAFLTVSNTILQYYLSSLLTHDLKDRSGPLGILLISAILSSFFFLRLSARSSFNSYIFASLPLILSYLLGGITGIFQSEPENPFHNSDFHLFNK